MKTNLFRGNIYRKLAHKKTLKRKRDEQKKLPDFLKIALYPKKLKQSEAFKKEAPAPFSEDLPPAPSDVTGQTFLEYLRDLDTGESDFFKYDKKDVNTIVQFGYGGRRFLWRIGKIAFAYAGENRFSGDLLRRIRIKRDGRVTHEYPEMDEESNPGGRKRDIIHFRWMVAQVLKKKPHNTVLSKNFKLFFSDLYLHEEGVKKYFRYQLLHPIFFGGHEKYIFIHALKDLHDRSDDFFLRKLGMNNKKYGIINWWKPYKKPKTMFGRVMHFRKKNFEQVYKKNPNSIALFIRHLHEHFIDKDNLKASKKPPVGTGQKRKRIPFHSEVEDKLSGRFPGIYASLVDGVIRGFHEQGRKKFKCTLSSLLESEPYGRKATTSL